jgi:DNA-binding transcriptional LysR family regulator
MEALEHDLRLRLFDRTTKGFALTDHGRALREAAGAMAEAAAAIETRAGALGRTLRGKIRVTAPELVINLLVAPMVAEFRRSHPEVLFEYDSSERFVDLVAGEADLAFRGMNAPTDDRLWGLRLADMAWSVYASRSYAAAQGLPPGMEAVRDHAVVAYAGPAGKRPGDVWFMAHAEPSRIVGSSNTVTNVLGLLRTGIGIGCLPCLFGDLDPELVRCFAPPPEMTTALWLMTTPERARVPRIEAFVRVAVERFRILRPALRGEEPLSV